MTIKQKKWSALIAFYALACVGTAQAQGAGQVAAAESAQGEGDYAKIAFKHLDSNADGRISPDEFLAKKQASWSRYAQNDAMSMQSCIQSEANGALDAAEGQKASESMVNRWHGYCESLDKKKDGKITWLEYAGTSWKYFKLLDANKDGFLDPAEFSDQGISALKRAPKPHVPNAALQARMRADLAKANAKVKAPRTQAEIMSALQTGQKTTSNEATDRLTQQRLAAAQGQTPPKLHAAPQSATQPVPESVGIAERIQNWLR